MRSRGLLVRMGMLLGSTILGGALAGFAWAALVRLPTYTVRSDLTAVLTELGHAEIIGADATFSVIGLFAGLILGILTWTWFRRVGWPSAVLAAAVGIGAGLVCWRMGLLLSPPPFADRIATAHAGDTVPISLELRSPSALALWSMASVAPVLFGAALGPELPDQDADPQPLSLPATTGPERGASAPSASTGA